MLYPLKPIYSILGKLEFVLDKQCPASKNLSKDFVEFAIKLSGEFLNNFKPIDIIHYVENFNKWPLLRGIELNKPK
jgi:hypothetical protein